jgi:hypothetical protein
MISAFGILLLVLAERPLAGIVFGLVVFAGAFLLTRLRGRSMPEMPQLDTGAVRWVVGAFGTAIVALVGIQLIGVLMWLVLAASLAR